MADSQDIKMEQFFAAIGEDLRRRRTQIERELADTMARERSNAENEARELSLSVIRTEERRAHVLAARQVAQLEESLSAQLAQKKEDIAAAVFSQVRSQIAAYTETPEYEEFLAQSAKRIAEYYRRGIIAFRVRQSDLRFTDAIRSAAGVPCEVTADAGITLGGLRAECEGSNVGIDDTLDARLESRKQEFFETSGLAKYN